MRDLPDNVLPFELDRRAAWDAILDHMGAVEWAHPDLTVRCEPLALTKLWVPAWVYRGTYEGQYGALSVMKYTVTQKQGTFGREKPAGSREDAHPVTGTLKNSFALGVVTADAGPIGTFVDAAPVGAIAGVRPASATDVDDAVVVPETASDSGPEDTWRRAGEARMRAHAVESVKDIVSGNEVRDIRVQVEATWTATRAWLPAWRLQYRFDGVEREVILDGRRANGAARLQADVPLDEAAKKRHDAVNDQGMIAMGLGGCALLGGLFVGHEVGAAAGWGLAGAGVLPFVYGFRKISEAVQLQVGAVRERAAARESARTRPVPS